MRLETSKSRLNIQWTKGPSANRRHRGTGTDSVTPWSTMTETLAGMARRSGNKPLMFWRDSDKRDPKVVKLLAAALKSERFQLASQWFYCVKVGDEVLQTNHPLNSLFVGRRPAALVLLSADTKKRVSFLGTKQQRVKWTPIASVLKASYKKNPTNAVKALHKLLYKFDALDSKKRELASQLARAEKKNNKYKAASVQKKMLLAKKDRTEVLAEEEKLRKLVLRASSDE